MRLREDVTDEMMLDYIRESVATIGIPPSVRSMADEFGLATGTVQRRLTLMAERGMIRRAQGVARGIVIVEAS